MMSKRKNFANLLVIVIMLGAVLASHPTRAQQRHTITGTVTDGTGQPVPGATVQLKGTKAFAIVGADGKFNLEIPANSTANEIIVKSLGFEPYTQKIEEHPQIHLTTNSGVLGEVVVVAYGTSQKKLVTGSLSSVSGTAIADKPVTSPDKALQGAVAGLQITSASGAPGSATDVRLRGIGSINASSSPLWVIDGAIANSGDLTNQTTTANALSTLNPDDIESITVLKDASATTLYGSRAANGVILVTTKKGKAGKSQINFNGNWGANSNAYWNKNNRPMTTPEYMKAFSQAIINGGEATSEEEAKTVMVEDYGLDSTVNTIWKDQVYQTGKQSQYNLSLSGGNEKTQYYASGGYFNQEGATIASYFKRYNGALSLNSKVTDRLSFSTNINGSYADQRTPSNGGYFANPAGVIYFALPWYSPRNADGSFNYGSKNDAGGGNGNFPLITGDNFNPLIIAAWDKNSTKSANFRGAVSGEYKILPNLKFTSRFSGEYLYLHEYKYYNPFYGDGYAAENPGRVDIYNTRIFDWTFTNLLNYHAKLDDNNDFTLDLTLGQESYKFNNSYDASSASGMPLNLKLTNAINAAKPLSFTSGNAYNATSSYLSNGILSFRNKYVLTGSYRRDGSSVFGANHRWGNFFSVGASWNVNEEEFLKNISWVNLVKLRASYGENGNSLGFGNYQAIGTYGYGYNYAGDVGSAPTNVKNDDLTWEKNKNFDIGVDWALFDNRLSGTFDYYHRSTDNLLVTVPLSYTTGYSGGELMNVGAMSNHGIEFSISAIPVKTKDFTWNVSFNIANNHNRVNKLYGGSPIASGVFMIAEGHDVQEYYMRNWKGVDQANGNPLWYTNGADTATTSTVSKVTKDFTGKSASPKWFGGFSNTFTYKAFSLSGTLTYSLGNYLYDGYATYYNSDGAYYGSENQTNLQLQAWTPEHTNTIVPKASTSNSTSSYASSTRYLYKGDYFRLRNVQFTYTLPSSLLSKLRVASAAVYVSANNIWTFGTDKYLPFDPEQGIKNTASFNAPAVKTVLGGVKIGF
ncbi:SusC/RagA family TonB-linked outer membrane protein [Chitinophaga sancti]|uniref:TonB-dependent receptor n=1 Tax=Chitinophaga sancti TaxID=1004 RepID=A0A1K1SXN0_9BACT|nr:TonB-dependent receptor [Chitinophaga sancti]WQD62287.1 TonB-dependent receptor [Chitinophaga sancti]WQG92144.1 TonB-dependent receptor [Chitinophaga sancti]SFW88996.1 TonB-linked outer membrane protein, SusC/RagA family [Chitinophaga sancti]